MLAKSVGLIKQTNPQIVQTLREDSEVLARIQSGFHTMIRARADQQTYRSLNITCFFEELPLIGIGEVSITFVVTFRSLNRVLKVVPKHSAILPGYTSIGIHENHIGMTKFEIEDDPGYVSVVGELRRWVKELKLEPGNTPMR